MPGRHQAFSSAALRVKSPQRTRITHPSRCASTMQSPVDCIASTPLTSSECWFPKNETTLILLALTAATMQREGITTTLRSAAETHDFGGLPTCGGADSDRAFSVSRHVKKHVQLGCGADDDADDDDIETQCRLIAETVAEYVLCGSGSGGRSEQSEKINGKKKQNRRGRRRSHGNDARTGRRRRR